MKHTATLIMILLALVSPAEAQKTSFIGKEPDPSLLGAPIYPGATFLRVMATIDPFFETVFYVSPDPVGDVMEYYRDKLPNARRVQYQDEYEWVWVYIYNPRIPFPDKPTRDDLPLLDTTANVMVKKFQKDLHEPLIELFQSRPDTKPQLDALLTAKTLIRFTFRIQEDDAGMSKLIGSWTNADRAFGIYRGCRIEFKPDGTYVLTLTDSNIAQLAADLADSPGFRGKSAVEIEQNLRERNPERGQYSILRNNIDLFTDAPVLGNENKSGLVEIQGFTFSVQFINMPKLTFIRDKR